MTMVKDAPLSSTSADPHKKIAELEARIAKLESVLKIGTGGTVTLKSESTLTIEASSSMKIKATGSMTIQSANAMEIKGSTVNIN